MKKDWDIIITNKSSLLNIDLQEVWRYRDLLSMYVKRDIITFYKQTILGPLWFVIQPLFTTIMFMFVFGGIAGISIFMTIAMPSWCEKWWITLAILGLSLFVAIPSEIRFRSLSKVLTIPGLVLRMLKNVLHMDRKNTDFIHTEHTT